MASQELPEMRSWKKVLLQWIIECGFAERNCLSIEQSNVDLFYTQFAEHHTVAAEQTLTAFLQTHYPEFSPHLDDENALSATDYIYVYSLLLHFSCVRFPEAFFHDTCQRLTLLCQQCIATLCKELVDCEGSITKEQLRRAIANMSNVAAVHMVGPMSASESSGSGNSSSTSGAGTNGAGILNAATASLMRSDAGGASATSSPLMTPSRRALGAQHSRISPSTPKTFLLEERTRELHNLRAQLETERYDKGLLEVQIKQNEEKILKLNQDHKTLQQEIHDLKNDILNRSATSEGTGAQNDDPDELLLKRRLCKDIAAKEQEIAKLEDLMNTMREENQAVSENLSFAQQYIITCMERISALDTRVDELQVELEQKNEHIHRLQEKEDDLEHHIAEMRSASANARQELNSSGDCLDASFVRVHSANNNSNSSAANASPENLGRSVVDVQLREQQCENVQLRKELGQLRGNNRRLAELIQQCTSKLAVDYNVDVENPVGEQLDDDNDPLTSFMAYSAGIDELGKCYKDEQNKVQQLQSRIADVEREINTLGEQNYRLVTQLEALASEYEVHREQTKTLDSELSAEVAAQRAAFEAANREMEALLERVADQDATMQTLSAKLHDHEASATTMKERHERLLIQHEAMKQTRREADDHLAVICNQLAVKELEMSRLGTEIGDVRQLNGELEQRINALLSKYKLDKQTSEATISSRDESIRAIANERDDAQTSLTRTQQELVHCRHELEAVQNSVERICDSFTEPHMPDDGEPLTLQSSLAQITLRVRLLLEEQGDARSKIECLEFSNEENGVRLLEVMEELAAARTLNGNYESQLGQMKAQKDQQNVELHAAERKLARTQYCQAQQARCIEERIDSFVTALAATLQQPSSNDQPSDEVLSELTGHWSALHTSPSPQRALVRNDDECRQSTEQSAMFDCEMPALLEETDQKLQRALADVQALLVAQLDVWQGIWESQAGRIRLLKVEQNKIGEQKDRLIDTLQRQLNDSEADNFKLQAQWRELSAEQATERDTFNVRLAAQRAAIAQISASLDNNLSGGGGVASGDGNQSDSPLFEIVADDNTIEAANEDVDAFNQLRQVLNRVVAHASWMEKQYAATLAQMAALCTESADLKDQLVAVRKESADVRDQLAVETAAIDRQLSKEVKRLCDDVQNQVRINERLSGENAALQIRLSLAEAQMAEAAEFKETVNISQSQQSAQLAELQTLNEKLKQQLESDSAELSASVLRVQQLEERLNAAQADHDNCRLVMGNRQKKLEEDLAFNESDLLSRDGIIAGLKAQLAASNKKRITAEEVVAETEATLLRLRHEMVDAVAVMRDDRDECKRELDRANANVTHLIQQAAAERIEKAAIAEERHNILQQLGVTTRLHGVAEEKVRALTDRLQALERQQVDAETQMQSMRDAHAESSAQLTADNEQLRAASERSAERSETLAQALHDMESRANRLDSENAQHVAAVAAAQTRIAALVAENEQLEMARNHLILSGIENEAKLAKLEKIRECNDEKVRKLNNDVHNSDNANVRLNLEVGGLNSQLHEQRKVIQAAEQNAATVARNLDAMANENARLTAESARLRDDNAIVAEQLAQLSHALQEQRNARQAAEMSAATAASNFDAMTNENARLTAESARLRDDNAIVAEQLAQVSHTLQLAQDKCSAMGSEIDQLVGELVVLRAEKSRMESALEIAGAKQTARDQLNADTITGLQMHVGELEVAGASKETELMATVAVMQMRIDELETSMAAKDAELIELWQQPLPPPLPPIVELKDCSTEMDEDAITTTTSVPGINSMAMADPELERMRTRLDIAEELLANEQSLNAQLRVDNQILHAKYRENKQRRAEDGHATDERIKEHRLEFEGKLEKMKNKMKTLYTDEMARVKAKQERETAGLKTEMDVLKSQNTKYEEHTRKLSTQIVRLNEQRLEQQKQTAMLATKLKLMTDERPSHGAFKRSTAAAAGGGAAVVRSNLTMEDEEGEVFNNTYLTDLKFGRMPELMSRDVCAEELQYRNSLLPPHLKSTYAAQYDHGLGEDELKDGNGTVGLDDSMIALLANGGGGGNNTTTSSLRNRKQAGATHYRRPGPPTPSKNGGRLSFGGSSEPPREILKETYDDDNAGGAGTVTSSSSATAKTPARFTFFTSRFSLGGGAGGSTAHYVKDEPIDAVWLEPAHDAQKNMRRQLQRRNLQFARRAAAAVDLPAEAAGTAAAASAAASAAVQRNAICTSTPRKSTTYHDQRRQLDLDQVLSASSPDATDAAAVAAGGQSHGTLLLSPIHCTPLRRLRRHSYRSGRRSSLMLLQQAVCPVPTAASTPSSPPTTTSSAAPLQRRLRRRRRRERGMRPSLQLHGNIFANQRTPSQAAGAVRDLNRRKAHRQRMDLYNRLRMLQSSAVAPHPINNNYASFNHNNNNNNNNNSDHINKSHNNHATIVICKLEPPESDEPEAATGYSLEDDVEGDSLASAGGDEQDEEEEENDNDNNNNKKNKNNSDDDVFDGMETSVSTAEIQPNDQQQAEATAEQAVTRALVKVEPRDSLSLVVDSGGDGLHFERLLAMTASAAPFHVQPIDYPLASTTPPSPAAANCEQSSVTTLSGGRPSSMSDGGGGMLLLAAGAVASSTAIAASNVSAAATMSTVSTSTHLCRTIYGGSIIFNRRLPHVNSTNASVRKSSIYIQKRAAQTAQIGGEPDVILIADQTITIVDLLRMWRQMSLGARLLIAFLACVTLTASTFAFVSWRH